MASAQTTASTLALLAGDDRRRPYMQQRMRYMASVLQVIILSTACVSKQLQLYGCQYMSLVLVVSLLLLLLRAVHDLKETLLDHNLVKGSCRAKAGLTGNATYNDTPCFMQVEFVVLVDRHGRVLVAPENLALEGTPFDPANIVSDVLSTGDGYMRR
jgi:hypothetical protein